MYLKVWKRVLDVVLTLAAMPLVLPLSALVSALIRISMGPPVLFRQIRPGLKGCPFTLYKFRTMTNGKDEEGRLLPDPYRVTPVGRLLRRTSLDELPQLLNVLRGDMSLVGPRPLLVQYLDLYTPEQARRHEVRPGITGLAQINGRNAVGWEQKFACDVSYVDRASLALDMFILWRTLVKVLRREDVSPEGDVGVEPFRGTALPVGKPR